MSDKEDRYKPVPFDPKKYAGRRRKKSKAFGKAYDALEPEFQMLGQLVSARKSAGLTQAELARRMGKKQSAVARIESSLGSRRHSPSLATLLAYAKACGKQLEIRFTDS